MQKQIPVLKAKIGVVVLMAAGVAFAAPYEVAGPDAPKPKRGVFARVPEVELPLEQGFLDPPKANRPQVWWWFDATAPDAAITRDMEGLKRVGISGFHIYGGSVTEKGWLPRAKWALHEANRLGLDGFVMIGAAGCGHAQTDPRHAQKDLVFMEARMESRRPGGETHEAAKMAALPVNAAKMAAPHTVTLPKKGVKETPKNADGAPLRIRISLALGMSHLIRRGAGRRSR